jgi:transposase/transposase InsO family protein
MPEQLLLPFEEMPIASYRSQNRYQPLKPILGEITSEQEQTHALNLFYGTITNWLWQFREERMRKSCEQQHHKREPYTPERVIVAILYFKSCVPKISDLELTRIVSVTAGLKLHHETVKALLERYFFWLWRDLHDQIYYPVPDEPHLRRLEMVKLRSQGCSEKTIAHLLDTSRNTVSKWLRRFRREVVNGAAPQQYLFDHSHTPHNPRRKVYFGTINAVLELQKKYGYAGWFRIQGYLEKDYEIKLSESTIKKIMAMNRRLHLAPSRPVEVIIRESKEGPPKSQHPFEHLYTDFRYLDAKPGGVQLYSCLLLEGLSRSILAGSLTQRQDTGVLLAIYYLALLEFGCWQEVITDNGGQFTSHAFGRINRRLQIHHHKNEKGHPWQNLIESQFGIQARLGEYGWERCRSVEEAREFHQQLIRDHNRLPHFAHRRRQDNKHTPLEVLGAAKGREVDAATLHRTFSRMSWNRKIDAQGFIRLNRWKIYVEAGLPKTAVQVNYWDGKLRAEYQSQLLAEYSCKWDATALRPKSIGKPHFYETEFQSRQLTLFDPMLRRDPINVGVGQSRLQKQAVGGEQLWLYFGPELVK